jgi:glycerol-3-phosphate dehydrogenase
LFAEAQRSQAPQLAAGPFDVAVVGGGIYGVAIAWKAAASELRVALFERADFGSGTSSTACARCMAACAICSTSTCAACGSRSVRAANGCAVPDYIVPVQCSIPTFGHGIFGARCSRWHCTANDVIGLDRNVGVEATPAQGVGIPVARPAHSSCSAKPVYAATTAQRCGTTGCAQLGARADRAVARAMALGAITINHFVIERILVTGKRVAGVVGTDALTGRTHEVRASSVVNASGPWLDDVIARSDSRMHRRSSVPRAFNLLTRRLPFGTALVLPCGASARITMPVDRRTVRSS